MHASSLFPCTLNTVPARLANANTRRKALDVARDWLLVRVRIDVRHGLLWRRCLLVVAPSPADMANSLLAVVRRHLNDSGSRSGEHRPPSGKDAARQGAMANHPEAAAREQQRPETRSP